MYKSLRDIPNPYQPYSEIKSESFFIGRKNEIEKIINGLNESIESGINRNFLIIGDKSIGKSSLLHILRQKLLPLKFLTVNFVVNQNKIESSLIFFKELFDAIINEGAPNNLLNKRENEDEFTQKEIWEGLTLFGNHQASTAQMKLLLGHFYAEAIKIGNFNAPLPEIYLIKDLEYLISEIKSSDYKSLVIIIDEFHLLKQNDNILQNLISVIERVSGISFILCGNFSVRSERFDKFLRKSEIIELKAFSKNEIWDFIYKPIQHYGFTKEEISKEINFDSLRYLFNNNDNNPYYLNLILNEMFDRYKKGISEKIEFTHDVSVAILEKLKYNSPYHEKITAQLNVAEKKQLQALSRLYAFQNINLDDIALIDIAFEDITENKYKEVLKKIIFDLVLVQPLQIFNIEAPKNIKLEDLIKNPEHIRNNAADIKYTFIGDAVDELYLISYISNALDKDLIINHPSNAIEFLNEKLFYYLYENIIKDLKFDDSKKIYESTFCTIRQIDKLRESNITASNIEQKINYLNEVNAETIDEEDYEKIQNSVKNTSLSLLPQLNKFLNLTNHGCYYIFVKVKIREKIFIYEYFITCQIDNDFLPIFFSNNYNIPVFEKYKVEILDIIVTKIKPKVFLVLNQIDLSSLYVMLTRSVYNGNYDDAIEYQEKIKLLNKDDEDVSNNNLGFINLLKQEFSLAEKFFDLVKSKDYTTLLNQAYLYYRLDLINKVEPLIKKAEKSFKILKPNEPLFFAMHQILIPNKIRKTINYSDFDLVFDVSCDLIIKGNKAILASFENQNYGPSLLKKAEIINEQDKFYKLRYEFYVYYNLKQIDKAKELLLEAEENFENLPIKEHIQKLIYYDKKILYTDEIL